MDRRERAPEPEEIFRVGFEAFQSKMFTASPGIVKAYPGSNGSDMTVDVQPSIRGLMVDDKGVETWFQLPVLINCPVLWQGGGGVTATFPIKANDECLVIFGQRCIDSWWQQGGIQNQAELRLHSISDGFALVGVRSLPRSFAIDTANAQLVTDDGQAYFKLNPTTHAINILANGGVTINASSGITMNGVTIDSAGNVNSPATVTASTDVVGGGKHLKTHVHSGVTSGGSNTGQPV